MATTSPVVLPRPYDISAVVRQALKLNSSSEGDDVCPAAYTYCPTKSFDDEEIKRSFSPTDDINLLIPITEDLFEDMDTGAWTDNNTDNMQELDRFYRYIDEEDIVHEKEKINSTTSRNKSSCHQQILMQPSSQLATDEYIQVELVDVELWRQFSEIGTEMVITKSGR